MLCIKLRLGNHDFSHQVGGDIQMSMDINEAIKEDIQVVGFVQTILFTILQQKKTPF